MFYLSVVSGHFVSAGGACCTQPALRTVSCTCHESCSISESCGALARGMYEMDTQSQGTFQATCPKPAGGRVRD